MSKYCKASDCMPVNFIPASGRKLIYNDPWGTKLAKGIICNLQRHFCLKINDSSASDSLQATHVEPGQPFCLNIHNILESKETDTLKDNFRSDSCQGAVVSSGGILCLLNTTKT